MTPHEESSEHASTPCLDPMSIGKDRFRPSASANLNLSLSLGLNPSLSPCKPPALPPPPQSLSRRSRSPTPPQTRLSVPYYTPIPEQSALSYHSDTNDSAIGDTAVRIRPNISNSAPLKSSAPSPSATPSISSTTPGTTVISPHVLANVQVHMVDSH